MSWLRGAWARVRGTLRRRAADARMDEEFRFHIDQETEANLRRGHSAAEARRRALLAFGGVDRHGEEMRRGRRMPLVEDLALDARLAARSLARSPGFTFAAVLTLSLGIGLATGMFSVVYGVLFRGPPYAGADRMVYVSHANPATGDDWLPISIHEYETYARHARSFESVMAVLTTHVTVSGEGPAERVAAARVSRGTFAALGVRPLRGRDFDASEERGLSSPVAIVSHELWQNRFAGDPDILGRTVRVDGRPITVIGVMPRGFAFPVREQLWLPLEADAASTPAGEGEHVSVIGMLHKGVSEESARTELAILLGREPRGAESDGELRPVLRPYADYLLGPGPRGLLLTMFGAVACVLLLACTNVANLLLARAIVRRPEFALRSALGAGRARILAHFLNEAALLCMAGAVAGTGVAVLIVRLFDGALHARVPEWMGTRIDAAMLLFTIAITVLTALLAGLLPALQALRSDAGAVLGDEGRATSGFRIGRASRVLVALQIALACALLMGAGLTSRSIASLRSVDLGFDDAGLLTAAVMPSSAAWPDDALPSFYAQLERELAAQPGLEAVTIGSSLPGLGAPVAPVFLSPRPTPPATAGERPRASWLGIAPSWLPTLGVDVAEGRNFTGNDRAGALPVALVNPAFARRFFPDGSALGRRIRLGDLAGDDPWRTIVGVIPDLRLEELSDANVREFVLIPLAQQRQARWVNVIARTRGEPADATPALRAAVARVDGDLPLLAAQTMRAAIAADTWFITLFGGLFGLFGAMALVMALVGLYGVLAFTVGQRTREIGIRMAIGATPRQVLGHVLRQTMVYVMGGMMAGLALATALSGFLSVILFDVRARDPLLFGTIVVALLLAALAACIVPARRATRIHPIRALKG